MVNDRFNYAEHYGRLPQFQGRDWTKEQAELDAYYDLRDKYLADYESWYKTIWGPAKRRKEKPPEPLLDEWVGIHVR